MGVNSVKEYYNDEIERYYKKSEWDIFLSFKSDWKKIEGEDKYVNIKTMETTSISPYTKEAEYYS